MIVGYEVSTRIGEAVMPSHYRFWHTTGTVGCYGAAAAAAGDGGVPAPTLRGARSCFAPATPRSCWAGSRNICWVNRLSGR